MKKILVVLAISLLSPISGFSASQVVDTADKTLVQLTYSYYLPSNISNIVIPTLDDSATQGDTTHWWSADKVYNQLSLKQDTLFSGKNIKTINKNSLLGSGDISISSISNIARGTSSLLTSAIPTNSCAKVVTSSAAGVTATDVINWGFNADPTNTVGYNPAGGLLFIVAYPSENNVNFKVCNKSGASITPGSMTLNWRVDR